MPHRFSHIDGDFSLNNSKKLQLMDLLDSYTVIEVIFLNIFCGKIYLALYTFNKLNCHFTHASNHLFYRHY